MLDRIKTIAKYATNILVFVNALIIGLNPIWEFPKWVMQISDSTIVIAGALGAYLLADKGYHTISGK